jgi:hypothetical protein
VPVLVVVRDEGFTLLGAFRGRLRASPCRDRSGARGIGRGLGAFRSDPAFGALGAIVPLVPLGAIVPLVPLGAGLPLVPFGAGRFLLFFAAGATRLAVFAAGARFLLAFLTGLVLFFFVAIPIS